MKISNNTTLISGDRQMTTRLNALQIKCNGDISTSLRMEPVVNALHYKSDACLFELIEQALFIEEMNQL